MVIAVPNMGVVVLGKGGVRKSSESGGVVESANKGGVRRSVFVVEGGVFVGRGGVI